MLIRAILPNWARTPDARMVLEGEFDDARIEQLNASGYNIYALPNGPSQYNPGVTVKGSHIDRFNYVFIDFDLKDKAYVDKESFITSVGDFPLQPCSIVDSGNGVHVYWKVSDLDAMSYLRLCRRLLRLFNTDPAVGQICQIMRVPGTVNTKHEDSPKLCEEIYRTDSTFTCEDMDSVLPPLSHADEEHCKNHYAITYDLELENITVSDIIPIKFIELLHRVPAVKEIWEGRVADRSAGDFRLGHLLHSYKFTQDEARSVLVNTAKAKERAPVHRIAYAENIIGKVWTAEAAKATVPEALSRSVAELLNMGPDALEGVRFACDRAIDATAKGFRLGQVIGLVAGSGVGKTAMALNMFRWFVKNNPNHQHFFIPLEQPVNEIASRWKTMAGDETHLHDKVHVISNYRDDGSFRHLTLEEIKDYILEFKRKSGRDIGCVVIDHIGALKKKGKDGENQDLMDICHKMKAFAIETNTLLVMQSQSSREKAGIGDLELSKDAAYGTVYFESYTDYLITIWQPLKRCYDEPACPTVTAYKFCKIRHKNKAKDEIQEDVPYRLMFDPLTEHMRPLTEVEEKSFDFFNKKATNKRKADRKTDVLEYTSTTWLNKGGTDGGDVKDHQDVS